MYREKSSTSRNSDNALSKSNFFLQSVFDLFSVIAEEFNQIRNINNRSSLHCSSPFTLVFIFFCALNTGRCNGFQHIFENQKKSEFYSPNYQAMLFLVTMFPGLPKKSFIPFSVFFCEMQFDCLFL